MKEQWIKDAKAGDEKAWSILYQQHYPWLYAISLQKCSDNNTAKDIAQDVFVQAYLKLHQLKDPAAFAGWLKTMLLRACYHAQKKFLDDRTHLVPVENEKHWEENFNSKLEICSRQT